MICGKKDYAGSCIRYNRAWHKNTGLHIEWIDGVGHNLYRRLLAYQDNPSLFTLMDLREITQPYNQPEVAEKAMLRGAFSPYLGIDDMRWMPIYFISGEMDYTCPTALAKEFYEEIEAPDKAFYEIKGCGHTPQGDKPKEVADIIAGIGMK